MSQGSLPPVVNKVSMTIVSIWRARDDEEAQR